MKKAKLMMIIVAIVMILIVGIIVSTIKKKETSKEDKIQNIGEKLINIEKVYYGKINSQDSYSMYIIYTIKSDNNIDIETNNKGASLMSGGGQCASYYYYKDQGILSKAGYSDSVRYETLYAGSDKKLKYIASFEVGKKGIEENKNLMLKVNYNGTVTENSPVTHYEFLEKTFKITEVNNFLYSDYAEFLKEFKKDHDIVE